MSDTPNIRFNAEQAFEATASGEPILVGWYWIERQFADHGLFREAAVACAQEVGPIDTAFGARYDAGAVLRCLGY